MRGDGCKKFMARMIGNGLKPAWLLSLRTKPRPACDCGITGGKLSGAVRELKQWGIIKSVGRASDGAAIWGPGQTYGLAAEIVEQCAEVR